MQPNQTYSPVPDPDQTNEPPVESTPTPTQWSPPQSPPNTPRQPFAAPMAQQSTPAAQPVATDFARYQPQPIAQIQPIAPIQPAPADAWNQPQPTAQPQPFEQSTVLQSAPTNQPEVQAPAYTPDQPPQPTAPAPLSPFEQQWYSTAQQAPTPKKSRIGLMIAGIAAAVLVLGGGGAAFAWIQANNSPEQRLNRAIESHMTITLIQQDYEQSASIGDETKVSLKSTSDFSDAKAPKSYVKYDVQSDLAVMTRSGELVVLDNKEYFAKLTKSANFEGMGSEYLPVINQWYRVDTGDFAGSLLLDPVSVGKTINVPTGEVLVGNFNESTRKELMAFIKEKGVYTIKSSQVVTVDGQKMTQYDIDLNVDALNELNKKAVKALGLPENSYDNYTEQPGQTNTFWVNHKTGRLAKAELTRDSSSVNTQGAKTKEVSTVTLSYPTNASAFTKPERAKNVPWKNL
jgi:hypothetical protein